MKQGMGQSRMAATKVEPRVHAVTPAMAGNIGIQQVRTAPMPAAGRGFTAPAPVACTVHKSGSQGRSK